jgi:F0F1-type ATP synthase assembly protein I
MNFARGTVMTVGLVGAIYAWFLFRGLRSEMEVLSGGHPLYLSILMVVLSILLVATVFAAGMRLNVWQWLAMGSVAVFLALVFFGQLALMDAAARAAERGVTVPISFVLGEIVRTRGPLSLALTALIPLLLLLSAVFGLILGSSATSKRASVLREA